MIDENKSSKESKQAEFDNEYSKAPGLLYGEAPAIYLDEYIKRENIKPGRAVDIACGTGRTSIYLAKHRFVVDAYDLSSVGIDLLQQEAQKHQVQVNTMVVDIAEFSFPPNAYDLVVADTIIDHLAVEAGKKLAKSIYSMTAPGGYMYVTAFTVNDPGYPGYLGSLPKSSTIEYVKHFFEPNELLALFPNAKVLRYHEELSLDVHSDGIPHYHSMARLLAKRV